MSVLGGRTLDWQDDAVLMVDQTRLPASFDVIRIETVPELVGAIRRLSVRGAPGSVTGFVLAYIEEVVAGPVVVVCGTEERAEEIRDDLERVVGGEGVGIEMRDLMPCMFGDADLDAQERIKAEFDMGQVLNPGKVFPVLRRCVEGGAMHVHGGEEKFADLERF